MVGWGLQDIPACIDFFEDGLFFNLLFHLDHCTIILYLEFDGNIIIAS